MLRHCDITPLRAAFFLIAAFTYAALSLYCLRLHGTDYVPPFLQAVYWFIGPSALFFWGIGAWMLFAILSVPLWLGFGIALFAKPLWLRLAAGVVASIMWAVGPALSLALAV